MERRKMLGAHIEKYTREYYLGGMDPYSKKEYGLCGYKEFNHQSIHPRFTDFFAFLKDFVGSLANKDILEIGFGRGELISLLLDEGINRYDGIDASKAAVQIASQQIKSPKVNLSQLGACDIEDSKSYDIIILNEVIEYIPVFEIDIVWEKIKRILRPGGYIILRTPLFENPNMLDNAEHHRQMLGLCCNKQTSTTLAQTCIKQKLMCVFHKGDCFGFIKKDDLEKFSQSQKLSFLNHENIFLSPIPASSNNDYSKEELRRFIPGAGRLVIGCVTENTPYFKEQTLKLIHSIRSLAGNSAGVNIFVCIVDKADQMFVQELQSLGVFVRVVARYNQVDPFANKFCFFELPEIHFYDTILYLDCDTVVVQDPYPHIERDFFQAKMVNRGVVPHSVFCNLFQYYNLTLPQKEYKTTLSDKPIIWYCNAGILILPEPLLQSFFPLYRKYTLDLITKPELLEEYSHFAEQISVSLAYHETKIPYKELPAIMNSTIFKPKTAGTEYDPVIFHYMKKGMTKKGYLKQISKHKLINKRIKAFNSMWKKARKMYALDTIINSQEH